MGGRRTQKRRAGAHDVARLDGIASHEDFAVTLEVDEFTMPVMTGDDDPVVADDAVTGGFGKGELVRKRGSRFPASIGIEEPGVDFPVAPTKLVMARGGEDEEPLFDPQMLITKGKGEVNACAPGVLCARRSATARTFALHCESVTAQRMQVKQNA